MTKHAEASRDAHPIILCVEDEEALRSDLAEELREAGYRVIEACDVRQATEQLQALRPDLILCDIHLPGGSGYRLLSEFRRAQPELADVPFVFLTALADPRDVVEGKRRGADDYLVKPIDYDLLLATIEARLRQVASIRQATQQRGRELHDVLQELPRAVEQDPSYRILDLMSLGVAVLRGDGTVVFANRAARDLANRGDGLSIDATVSASEPRVAPALRQAISAAVSATQPDAELPVSVSIPRPSGRRDVLVMVFRLPPTPVANARAPAAVVILRDPEHRSRVPDRVLGTLFGLTPAESQVATLLAEGLRAEQIAQQLQVSPTTVAFHIRNLLGKTGTSRQTDLIALLLVGPMSVMFD